MYKDNEDLLSGEVIMIFILIFMALISTAITVNFIKNTSKDPIHYNYICIDGLIYYNTNKNPVYKVVNYNAGRDFKPLKCIKFIIKHKEDIQEDK